MPGIYAGVTRQFSYTKVAHALAAAAPPLSHRLAMPTKLIDSISYERDTRKLRVVLGSGKQYLYRNVPVETYSAMVNSFSREEFYDMYIRGHFEFVRYPAMEMPFRGVLPLNPADHYFRR